MFRLHPRLQNNNLLAYNAVQAVLYTNGGYMEELRRLRKERGFTQRQLAEASGVDRVSIIQIESGQRSPTVTTLGKLADTLGVEVADFFPKVAPPLPFVDVPAAGRPDRGEERRIRYLASLREFIAWVAIRWREAEEAGNREVALELGELYVGSVHPLLDDHLLGAVVEGRLGEPTPAERRELVKLLTDVVETVDTFEPDSLSEAAAAALETIRRRSRELAHR